MTFRSDSRATSAVTWLPIASTLAIGAYGLAVLLVPIQVASLTFAATSPVGLVLDLLAGWSLLALAIVASVTAGRGRLALAAAAAGVVWFAPDWIGWFRGPVWPRSIAMAAEPLLAISLAWVAATSTRPLGGGSARILRHLTIATITLAVGRSLIRDPFLDPDCVAACEANALLVIAMPDAAAGLTLALRVASVGIAVWMLIGALHTIRACSRSAAGGGLTDARSAVAIASAGVAVALGASAAALIAQPFEHPRDPVFVAAFAGRAITVGAFACSLVWLIVEERAMLAAIARLTTTIAGDGTTSLRDALATALRDPTVEVSYPGASPDTFVDHEGRPHPGPDVTRGRARFTLSRAGEPLAYVVHAEGPNQADVNHAIGAAARLAVDNERLRARILGELRELRASRKRIVEQASATRRALERDLHDGAQQQVLALSLTLQDARAGLTDDAARAAIEQARTVADEALGRLREIAHGVYPEILADRGLGAALRSLAERAPVIVELEVPSASRCDSAVEAALYEVAQQRVAGAPDRDATLVRIRVESASDRLALSITDDAPVAAPIPHHLVDAIEALGGTVMHEADAGERWIRSEVPCASS